MHVRGRRGFEKVLRGLAFYKLQALLFLSFFLEELVSVSKRKDQSRRQLRNTMGVFRSGCWLHGAVGVAALGRP